VVNQGRLGQEFINLLTTDSLSKQEGKLAVYLKDKLASLGAAVTVDQAGQKINGETGNIIARFSDCPSEGNASGGHVSNRLSLMLNAHMDTVKPGTAIKPLYRDGGFYASGETILGADDKSGIAIILEAIQSAKEQGIALGELGVVFTVAEEIGLLGAKHLDCSGIKYKHCLVYDGSDRQVIINRAPAANRLKFKLYGREAHAGVNPEKGINAIHLASQAIARMQLGRIDSETTANIGTIQGGTATNIVPNLVEVHGEARSHDPQKLALQTQHMRDAFFQVVDGFDKPDGPPRLEEEICTEYPLMNVAADSPLIKLVQQAAQNMGQELQLTASGGGSDANIFNGQGIETIIMGTGMQNVHTTKESITLQDMSKAACLLVEILKANSQ
jgi:tripeptide aminopeptidase